VRRATNGTDGLRESPSCRLGWSMTSFRAAWQCAALSILAAACGGGGGFPDAAAEPDATPLGTFSVDWSLVKMSDGTPLACDPIGAQAVTLVLRNRALDGGFTEVFSCNTKMGTTPGVPIGVYDVKFELNGISGLIATGTDQIGVDVTAGNTTPLQPVTFTVNAIGRVSLTVDSLKVGGNCAPLASNGAGITNMRITLNHASGGACEPATVLVGATPYTISCTAPTNVPCFEKTVAITSATLPADNYQIHVRADQSGPNINCYSNDDSIRVPPNNGLLTRTLNLGATGAAGCL
jgi:hypothetical protein